MLLCKKTGFWITSNMLIQLIELASDEQIMAVCPQLQLFY
jgi:hypothetical protein